MDDGLQIALGGLEIGLRPQDLVGKDVEAHGLVGRADLNGKRGTVVSYDESKGRCAAQFGNSPGVLIKPSNLQVPAVSTGSAVPFEAGSVVTHLDGRKFQVLQSKAGGVVVAGDLQSRQQVELAQELLVLLDTPRNTCPTGHDLIVQSPSVGQIDQCDALTEIVAERAAPPQLMEKKWDSFDICAQRCGARTLEGLITEPKIAWRVPPGYPAAPSRIIFLALDAVAHHMAIEWRQGRGWRVLQSYLKPERSGAMYDQQGYTALEWLRSTRACGGTDTSTHRRLGQGQWLKDGAVLELLRAILRLRSLCDALVRDCLLAQTPFDIGPCPTGGVWDADGGMSIAMQAWLKSVHPAMSWAAKKINAAEVRGATILRPAGQDVQILLGDPAAGGALEEVLRIPAAAAAELDKTYAAITGEAFSAIHYLRLLNYAESDYVDFGLDEQVQQKKREKERERERLFKASQLQSTPEGALHMSGNGKRDVVGWAVRIIHWGED